MLADAIQERPSFVSAVLLITLAVVTVGFVSPVGAQNASATEIDACTTINDPGRYVLTDDITDSDAGTCLDVRADDVVIDGNGHTIDGQSGSDQDGVGVRSQSNVVVRNLVVSEWDVGVNYSQVTNSEVRNVVAQRNTAGIELGAGSENTIVDNTVRDTGNGIYLHAVDDTTADRNTIRGNEVTNTSLAITFIGADNNTVTDNTLRKSGVYGLSLLFAPMGNDYNEFRDNVVIDSAEDGVCLLKSRHNTFENTYVENSGRYDVYAVNGSTDNRMTNLTLTSTTLSTTLRDVSLVAVDDPPAQPPAGTANASAVGYVNATDTSPGTDAGSEVYLAVEAPGANGSSGAANGVPVYQYAGNEWASVGESGGENATGTNVTDLGEAGSHQMLAFVGEPFANDASAPSTDGSGAGNASEAGTGTGTETGAATTGTGTSGDATDTGTDGSGATDATDTAGRTDGTGATTTGGESATETSGPGFGLVIAALAVLGASLLAARRD